jgi:D-alanine-D-alanine ligase-like ATP-grasp enzyme
LLTLDELASAWRADSATARLLASLSELEDARLLVAPAPSEVAILAIRHRHGYRILVANLRLEPSTARVRLPLDGPWSMTSLTAADLKTGALSVPANREVTIRLAEVEVQRLDR